MSGRSRSSSNAPSAPAVGVIVDLLRRVLPPLQARVRKHRLEPFARRLAGLTDPRDFAGERQQGMRLATLVALTIRAVNQLQAELVVLDHHIATQVDAYAQAKTEAERVRRLELMIEDTAPDARSARADRQALKRHLDLDALRERYDLRREAIMVAIEIGLLVVGPAIAKARESEAIDAATSFVTNVDAGLDSEVKTMLDQVEPISFLLRQLRILEKWPARSWPARLACVESLESALAYLGVPAPPVDPKPKPKPKSASETEAEADEDLAVRESQSLEAEIEHLLERSDREHEWVQARTLACLRIIDRARYGVVVSERLALEREPGDDPEWPERDFLVRALIIDQLGAQLEDDHDAELLARAIERGDPSEFVRLNHAKQLAPMVVERPAMFERFASVLARIPGDSDDFSPYRAEDEDDEDAKLESPRVHGHACLAMTRGLEGLRVSADAPRTAALIVERLAATIVGIADPLVARIACEQAAKVCAHISAHPALRDDVEAHARTLVEALHTCLADASRAAAIQEEASAAIEGIDCALRPERAVWTESLAKSIAQVPPGRRRRVPVPAHRGQRPDEAELGRILPILTRNDWGLDVDPRGAGLDVRRGDHLVFRAWRVLHELRHPAGNKRQAHRHSVGRRYVGRLRAHPGRLDEVTATVVPGERLHLDGEGGWGRHLPLVDDLLGLPWLRGGSRSVELASTHGRTRLKLRGGLGRRLRARWRLNFRYAELAELRRRALSAEEPSERRRFAEELRERYGIELEFEVHRSPYGERPTPPRLGALFPKPAVIRAKPEAPELEPSTEAGPDSSDAGSAVGALGLAGPAALALPNSVESLRDLGGEVMRDHLHYFLTLEGNSQEALGYFALGLSALFFGSGYLRRRVIANARAAIPLSIGGWGTRGKSGTERLKAGMLHGLGFRIFSKTTGCEAMFIHAPPLGPQVEIFTFRPYGKATIWEQRNLLTLAAGLESEVFMWECMALNPEYVDILQRGWMRDDYATITNTYPDHEDIQGPAGIDVARVIGRFVPQHSVVISSELGFNPVLRDSAAERRSDMIEIGDYEGDLLAEDLLALFPYAEHPRNIALVTELARQLGIDEDLAIVCMADYVYPDLGVLKFYPEVRVRGRTLAFVNGCSANERAGFLNNWRRTGCIELAAEGNPARMVMTVVNNRDDRISRSEVFSRILVNDVAVDAHVLIGTNLAGLQIFMDRALDNFTSEIELVDAEALASGEDGRERARTRLRALLMRVRAPVEPWSQHLEILLELGLGALGRRYEASSSAAKAVHDHVASLRADEGSRSYETIVAKLASDQVLSQALRTLHDHSSEDRTRVGPHEVSQAPEYDEWVAHLRDRIARMAVAARLAGALEGVLEARDSAGLATLTAELAGAWSELWRAQLIVVWDSGATGDQIIDQCSRAVPPGVHVTIMGTQNIKGTGLDFIYRWQALDAVCEGLDKLDSEDVGVRLEALRALDAHSDFGFTDTGILVQRLPEVTKGGKDEVALRRTLLDKIRPIHQAKLAKLGGGASGAAAKGGRFWTWVEGWIDFMDGAVRYRQSQQLVDDLIHQRVSHNKMAVEMREIYARAKGGWLGKALAARLSLGRGKVAEPAEGGGPDEPQAPVDPLAR